MPATTIKQLMSKAKNGPEVPPVLKPDLTYRGEEKLLIFCRKRGTGFTDERVRAAFKDRALELAALRRITSASAPK